MKGFIAFVLGISLLVLGDVAASQEKKATVLGSWQTLDPDTHQPASVIAIWEDQGKYFGKVSKVFHRKGEKVLTVCTACQGIQHNQPILGLVILGHFRDAGFNRYVGGSILDPRTGKIYHAIMTVSPDGQCLKVHGYIGFSLIGATDIWYRVP